MTVHARPFTGSEMLQILNLLLQVISLPGLKTSAQFSGIALGCVISQGCFKSNDTIIQIGISIHNLILIKIIRDFD